MYLSFAFNLHTFPEIPKALGTHTITRTHTCTQEIEFSTLLLNKNASKYSV